MTEARTHPPPEEGQGVHRAAWHSSVDTHGVAHSHPNVPLFQTSQTGLGSSSLCCSLPPHCTPGLPSWQPLQCLSPHHLHPACPSAAGPLSSGHPVLLWSLSCCPPLLKACPWCVLSRRMASSAWHSRPSDLLHLSFSKLSPTWLLPFLFLTPASP